MTEIRYSKKEYMTCVQSEPCSPTPRLNGDGEIWTVFQDFTLRVKHKKGSTRPPGWFHSVWTGSESTVGVRWLYTEAMGHFAPQVTFYPSTQSTKIVNKIAKALREMRNDPEEGPEKLLIDLKATVVEYVDDRKEGTWDDYRPLRVPGEPSMKTIARYAS